MNTPIKFGTDGWRAIIAADYTFANVRICAQATAMYLHDAGLASRGVVVGYDTRFASEDFAAAAAEVLAANGITVHLASQPAPTPVIGYAILTHEAGGAVIITASHNPAAYNGFKIRTEYAGSAPPGVLERIEAMVPAAAARGADSMPLAEAQSKGVVEVFDPRPAYMDHLAGQVDLDRLREAGLRVVLDPMYGAGSGYLRELLSGGANDVLEIRGERNPAFPGMHNPEPITRNLAATAEAVRSHAAQLALATDGDADRIGLMDGDGRFVDQLLTFGLLAYYLLEERGERGAMVKSVTTTSMIFRLGEVYGVPVHETPVGFKHLGPKMRESDAIIAGEESGGFAFRGHIPERDGILSGLLIFDLMARRKKELPGLIADLFEKAGPHYYDRIDIELTPEARARVAERLPDLAPSTIAGVPVKGHDRTDGLRFILADDSWALIRLSGTEPLMRVYTEVRQKDLVQPVLQAVRELTGV